MPRGKKKQEGDQASGGGGRGRKAHKKEKDLIDAEVDELVLQLCDHDNTECSRAEAGQRRLVDYLQQNVEQMYPHIGQETYRVPDVHINKGKVKDIDNKEEGIREYVAQATDARSDRAHNHVSNMVYQLSRHFEKTNIGPFFIISSYEYDNFLARLKTAYEEKPDSKELHSINFPKGSGEQRGEIDIMVIFRKHVIFIEIKAIGDNFTEFTENENKIKEVIADNIIKATSQLIRDEKVFNHVMKDLNLKGFTFTKIAALPNLERRYLNLVLQDEEKKKMYEDYVFLCKDDVPRDGDNKTAFEIFKTWWIGHVFKNYSPQQLEAPGASASAKTQSDKLAESNPDTRTPLDEIKIIVGRYVGFMSVVTVCSNSNSSSHRTEIRRKGQSVLYVGQRFSDIVLTNDQKEHLEQTIKLGYLSGPPGSGKTVVLAIKARRLILKDGHYVVVVNMYRGAQGRAIGHQIHRTITSVSNDSQRSYLREHCTTIGVDVDDFDKERFLGAITKLWGKDQIGEKGEKLMFIVDETYVQSYWTNVFSAMREGFPESSMWCAGLYGKQPDNFTPMELKLVIRCPPSVQRVLSLIDWDKFRQGCYISDGTQANLPTNGPDVLTVLHEKHGEFAKGPPSQCPKCGEDLAKILSDKLQVEKAGESNRPADLALCSLKCSDVLFLINMPRSEYWANEDGHLDTTEEQYKAYMEGYRNCPMLETLKKAGYPYKVHSDLSSTGLLSTETNTEEKVIHVTWIYTYQGLENKVIIFLPGDERMPDDSKDETLIDPLKNIPCPGLRGARRLSLGTLALGESKDESDGDMDARSDTSDDSKTEPSADTATSSNIPGSPSLGNSTPSPTVDSQQGQGNPSHIHRPMINMHIKTDSIRDFEDGDVECYTRWDKNNLFISASRCTSQLILITR